MAQPGEKLLASLIDTELIYQNAPSGYISILPGGEIIKLNNTLLGWLGYTEKEILSLNFGDLLSKGGNIHYQMFFRPMVSISGNVKELNYELKRKDGTAFPALLNANAVNDEAGTIAAVNIIVTDITQRNLYEKELLKARNLAQAEKDQFEMLANLAPEMIWTINNKGEITYVNQRISQYFNLPVKDITVEKILSRIHEEDIKILNKRWGQEKSSGKEFKASARVQKDEAYEWFEIKIIPHTNPVSDIKWFGTAINVNAHVMALQRKDEFISIASHEMKTPLTTAKAYLQLLEMSLTGGDEQSLVFAKKATDSVNRLNELITELFDASKIKNGKLNYNITAFSFNDMINDTVESVQYSSLTHTVIKSGNVPQEVTGDKHRLQQVVINLLNNAIKYSPGARAVFIHIKEEDKQVIVAVKDNGIGISNPNLQKIFERYYRVEGHNINFQGLGIGLYISHEIIQRHGGRLWAESEPGKGSTFYFSIPLAN